MTDCIKSNADVVMIDEFQFIQSQIILEIVNTFKNNNKTLYIFGLDKIANGDEWPAYSVIKNLVDNGEIVLKDKRFMNLFEYL